MNDKIYLQRRTEYLLQKAVESEIEKMKVAMAHDANADVGQGAKIMSCTSAQCAWNYATKHLIALRDMVLTNNFSNRDDVLEKIQDIQNYLTFIWCISEEEREKLTTSDTCVQTVSAKKKLLY